MNRQQLIALPAVIDVPTAAKALGLSRTAAYELIRNDQWPTPVFRLGRLIRIPTAPILELLGIRPVAQPASRPSASRPIQPSTVHGPITRTPPPSVRRTAG